MNFDPFFVVKYVEFWQVNILNVLKCCLFWTNVTSNIFTYIFKSIVICIIFFMLRFFTRGSNTNWNQGQQFLILANLADWQPWAEANSITNFWAFSPFISKHFEFFKIIKYQIRFLTAQIFLGKHSLVKAHVSNIKYLTFI